MIIKFEVLPVREGLSAYFDYKSNTAIYQVRIEIDNEEPLFEVSSCDCDFGSYWGQTQKNKEAGKICRHLKECLKLLRFLNYIKKENGRRKTGSV